MAKLLKLRRGTTSQHSSFTGAEGEVTIDTNKDVPVVHDGSTAGGHPVAAEDMSNVSSASIAGRLGSAAIAGTKVSPDFGSQTITTTGTLDIPDNARIKLGTGDDLQIYHDGTSSRIENDEGNLTIKSDGTLGLYSYTGTEAMAKFIANGAAELYHNNTKRLETTSAGVDITGNVDVDGSITCNDLISAGALLHEGDSNTLVHFENNDEIHLKTNGSVRGKFTNAGAQITGNLDVSSGVDVTGNITATGDATINGGDITILGAAPKLHLTDSGDNPDFYIENNNGQFRVVDGTTASSRFDINSDGHIDVTGNLDAHSGIDVTGNITCTGTVDGRDIASDANLLLGITQANGVLHSNVTATTANAGTNSTAVATTAFVTTAIANADAFPSGTKMLFQQTSAPTGWTKVTSGVDNKALRVVSGSASSGGSNAFSNTFASKAITANSGNTTAGGNVSVGNTAAGGNISVANANTGGNVNSHTLSTNEMPSHSHSYSIYTHTPRGERDGDAPTVRFVNNNLVGFNTGNTGGSGGHSHGFTGGAHNHNANFSGSNHNHNASFSGSAHNHSISVTNLDMGVQYLDVIIASKD